MHYMILDSVGNAVATFDDREAALDALEEMVEAEAEAAEHLTLLSYDDKGDPVGAALTVEDVRSGRATVFQAPWVAPVATVGFGMKIPTIYRASSAASFWQPAIASGDRTPASASDAR